MGEDKKMKLIKIFEIVASIIIAILAVTSVVFFVGKNNVNNSDRAFAGDDNIITNEEQNVSVSGDENIFNYDTENNHEMVGNVTGNVYINSQENNKIELISEELCDISSAGAYPDIEDGKAIIDNAEYYKKGIVLRMLLNNESNYTKSITKVIFVTNDLRELKIYEIDFVPVDFNDYVSIYAINNGGIDITDVPILLGATFNDIWDGTEDITYEFSDSLTLDLLSGEIKEIRRYNFNELKDCFADKEGWLHVIAISNDNNIVNFNKFICNIVHDTYTESEFYSQINQGGDGGYNFIPIYIDVKSKQIEEKNTYPIIDSNGITVLDFVVFPDSTVDLDFMIEIDFSDNTKIVSDCYSAKILVPIYDDIYDYSSLQNTLKLNKSRNMLYGKGNETMDSSFIYDPRRFSNELMNQ